MREALRAFDLPSVTARATHSCRFWNRPRSLRGALTPGFLPIERSGAFKGLYHCLGGKLSPLDNVTPEDLRIGLLLKRLEKLPGVEIILALSADVEGEATANYLSEMLEKRDCSLTRLAQGLPAGGDLEHADALTVSRAFEGRR